MRFFDNRITKTRINSTDVKLVEMGLGYFVGPFLAMISNAIFGTYLNQYFNNVLGMSNYNAIFAVAMPIISVIFVIVGNLVVGQLIAKTKTSAGKARPFLLISIPIIILAIVLLFIGPKNNSIWQLVWIAVSYNLYYAVAYPLFYTAHSAMVGLSTRNLKHRGILSTFSNASGVAAVGIGASIVFPFFQGFLFVNGNNGLDVVASYNAWKIFMVALCIVTFVGILIEYYYTRERITEETNDIETEEKITIKKQLKSVVNSKDWWILMIYFLLFQFGGLIKNGSMGYYCYAMFNVESIGEAGAYQGLLGLIGGIPIAVGMVIAWPIASKIGKRNSMILGFGLSVIGGLASFIDTTNFVIVCVGVVLKGVGSIPGMYVSLALLSDVLDHLEAKNGYRSDGLTMSIYSSIMVGLSGLGTGIVNLLLSRSGYNFSDLLFQTQSAKIAVVWCYLGIELICYGVLVIILLFTNVEKNIVNDQKIILEKKLDRR